MDPNHPPEPEPWLRGTLTDVPGIPRTVLHALELAKEDLLHWCGALTDAELNARPAGIAPVAFQVRHIARSLDRLLTYAEGNQLSSDQLAQIKAELDLPAKREELFAELDGALRKSAERIRALDVTRLNEPRAVGKKNCQPRWEVYLFTSPITRNATWGKPSPPRRSCQRNGASRRRWQPILPWPGTLPSPG